MSRDADALPRGRRQGGGAAGARNLVVRIVRAWNMLEPEQRLAALAALALWVTMLLPWYVDTIIVKGSTQVTRETLTAFGSFSFVEAAVLLVSAGVLALLFARAERRAFHLPGGDGFIITAGGAWTAILIFYRMLDTPHASVSASRVVTDVGLKWGIFVALLAAIGLAWAGVRVKAAHRPEPDYASDPTVPAAVRPTAPRPPAGNAPRPARYPPRPSGSPDRLAGSPASPSANPPRSGAAERTERTTRAVTREDAEQLSFDVPEPPPSEPDPFGERRR